jgi:hypothetical protein|tara:strand:+ start:923 stop:1234 length:312 start_codon:yes stop_codon:yes gene_type:complete
MIIIYNFEGNVAVLEPKATFKDLFEGTEEDKLVHIGNAQLPDGTKFEVSPFDTVDMEDRTVGNDWVYKGTARERTSVALSESEQAAFQTIKDEYVMGLHGILD